MGDFQINFGFVLHEKEVLNNAFQKFADCSALNNENEDDGIENMMNFNLDEMITAKDIDENGNIIAKNF